ncbi:unnamed protein product [Sphagnum jensenii]|uniref:Uncharacterized protein n=1 Tax=Sphagnum jensenii TaxID=128206 RepID=A0ABP0XBD1_9BRYO
MHVCASACTDVRSTVTEFCDHANTVFRCQLPKPLGLRFPLINQLRRILFNGEEKRRITTTILQGASGIFLSCHVAVHHNSSAKYFAVSDED